MRQILIDIKRAIFSKLFLVSFFAMIICLCLGALSEIITISRLLHKQLPCMYYYTMLLKACSSEIVLFAIPILSTIPYTTALVEDFNSGFLRLYLSRMNINRYIAGKWIGVICSGGLVAALGLLATLGIFKLLCHPFEIYNQYNETLPLISNFILEIIVFFLSGALWASVGLLCSSLKKNRYLAYTTPFIFFFTLCFLQENYFQRFYLLNPKNYMIFQSGCLIAGKDAVVLLVLYVASVLLIFYMLISKELHDKNLQKSIIIRKFVHSQTEKRNNRIEKKHKVSAGCNKFLQVIAVVKYNFIMWHNNVRVFFTFVFAGILCSFLSNKAFSFAHEMGTTIQVFEPFIWTFGDAKSILLISILLILLFSDMPILGASAPFYLIRIDRKTWVWGQLIYLTIATLIYILFILCITILLSMKNSYIENIWSETAVILGYSDAGKEIALPTFIKTLEMSYPYQCARTIFLLMLFYTLVLTLLMLLISLLYGKKASITVAFGFSLYGLLLNPELIKQVLKLPDKMMYKANIAVGWFSPLNQATYHMHSFGYDFLPSLYQTYFVFFMLIAVLVTGILSTMRHYNYNFIGSDIL